MFTGIIQALGTLRVSDHQGGDVRMTFEVPHSLISDAQPGDSMCVSGACLTMLDLNETGFSADVSVETLEKTSLGSLEPGDQVNLEPALRATDRLGGHLVSGHVDGVGELFERRPDGRAERFVFKLPEPLAKYVVTKGSICIDGVSLTVNGVNGSLFDVCLIPHTLDVTSLGALQPGSRVNIEIDMLARYVEKLLTAGDVEKLL